MAAAGSVPSSAPTTPEEEPAALTGDPDRLIVNFRDACVYERDATPREPRLPLGLTTNGAHEFVIVATAPPSGAADVIVDG